MSTLSSGHRLDMAGQQETPQGPMEGCPGRSTHHQQEGPCRVGRMAGGVLSALRPAAVFRSPKGTHAIFGSPNQPRGAQGSASVTSATQDRQEGQQEAPPVQVD